MDEKIDEIITKLDRNHKLLNRLLSILDAKELKKQKDRERIKNKRDQEATRIARERGAIVVDKLQGTFERDSRLPYKKWAYIMLEFTSGYEFLRWLVKVGDLVKHKKCMETLIKSLSKNDVGIILEIQSTKERNFRYDDSILVLWTYSTEWLWRKELEKIK